ncbi:hypothetical protein B0T16DRAFT_407620 [Cercophora newfieldiana]|uniref:Uncharacterized protein n=1 Tax=Cercophora newfieldiana TaxID=92897 RepID=A0AA39YBK5_9PEZI|nr:hypothetical protein B0T16DRAFT_407620 [Cercophora newfieldiana]
MRHPSRSTQSCCGVWFRLLKRHSSHSPRGSATCRKLNWEVQRWILMAWGWQGGGYVWIGRVEDGGLRGEWWFLWGNGRMC